MKKLLALLISVCVLASPVMAAEPAKTTAKPQAVVKKQVKKHKKAQGTKVAGTKPDTAPAKNTTKKK